ncbi:MAG: hypothetical protein RIC85_04095 [Gammaproteobacteria bacterium]
MAIFGWDPDKPNFSIETAALGRVDILPLTTGRMKKLGKIEGLTPREFTDKFLISIGRKTDGTELVDEDTARLSDAEREEFANQYLDNNQNLFREKVQEKYKDEDGKPVISYRNGDILHQREDEELSTAYLYRLYKIEDARWQEQMRKLTEPFAATLNAHKKLFNPSFLETFAQSQSASTKLGDMIKSLRPNLPEFGPTIPTVKNLDFIRPVEGPLPEKPFHGLRPTPNPIHDTNERLSDVVDRLVSMEDLALQMAETVKGVSDSASQFLVSFGAASDNADRTSRRAIFLAATAIIVALLSTLGQIGYSEWRIARDQDATSASIESLSQQIEIVVEAQRQSMGQIGVEINNSNSEAKESFDRLSTALEGLTLELNKQTESPTASNDPPPAKP